MFYTFENIPRKELNGKSGIYRITNEINGKIYIGSAINIYKRWNEHKNDLKKNEHAGSYLQRTFNKYGEAIFTLEVLQLCDKRDLLFYEQQYIDITQCFLNKFGYNTFEKAGSAFGSKRTPEQKKKQSIALLKYHRDPKNRQKDLDRFKKLSIIKKGQKPSQSTILGTIRVQSKKVLRVAFYGNVEEYSSIKEASILNTLNRSTLVRIIDGKRKNDTKYFWFKEKNIRG